MGIGIVAKVVTHDSVRATLHGQAGGGIDEPWIGELIVEGSSLIRRRNSRETRSRACGCHNCRAWSVGNLVQVVGWTVASENMRTFVGHVSHCQAHGIGQLSLDTGVPSVQSRQPLECWAHAGLYVIARAENQPSGRVHHGWPAKGQYAV